MLKTAVGADGIPPLSERHMLVCKGGIMIAWLSSVYGWELFDTPAELAERKRWSLPEIPFIIEEILQEVKKCTRKYRRILIL